MITFIVEYPTHCDIVRCPASAFAGIAYSLNFQPDVRYWIQRSADRLPAYDRSEGLMIK